MSKGRKKPIEWKDTSFIFSPKYQHSLFVRNRFVFFHAKAANVKKMINFANNFTCTNNICAVYVYGNINQAVIKPLIDKCKNQIMLMIVPDINKSDFDILDEYEKWLIKLKSQAQLEIVSEGKKKSGYSNIFVGREYGRKPSKKWFIEYEKNKDAVNQKFIEPCWLESYEYGIKLMDDYQAIIKKINESAYGKLAIIANFNTQSEISGRFETHSEELNEIAKQVFPYGVEADTKNESAVKVALIKKLKTAAYQNDSSVAKLIDMKLSQTTQQVCFWNEFSIGASEALEKLKSYMSDGIKNKGYFSISEAWLILSKLPFGAYSCNWYEYIFALALKDYHDSKYFYGWGISSQRINPIGTPFAKMGTVFIQTEEQKRFRKIIIKLFDIKKPSETVQSLIYQAITWVGDNIQYVPVHAIDERLKDLLFIHGGNVPNERLKDCKDTYWYQFGYENQFDFIRNNFDFYYSELRQADTKFKKWLSDTYGARKAELYCKYYYVKGGAFSWLYKKSDMEERVKKYMESIICRECGKVMDAFPYQGTRKIHSAKSDYYDFSLKDIIGINKKLLGRYQEEYFCIPCLCNYLNETEEHLYEMIHDFKETGCTLFA